MFGIDPGCFTGCRGFVFDGFRRMFEEYWKIEHSKIDRNMFKIRLNQWSWNGLRNDESTNPADESAWTNETNHGQVVAHVGNKIHMIISIFWPMLDPTFPYYYYCYLGPWEAPRGSPGVKIREKKAGNGVRSEKALTIIENRPKIN